MCSLYGQNFKKKNKIKKEEGKNWNKGKIFTHFQILYIFVVLRDGWDFLAKFIYPNNLFPPPQS